MIPTLRHAPALLALAALGCTATSLPHPVVASTAASSCVGAIGPAPEGARAVDDPALLALAVGHPREGKLCAGSVFEALTPITVYRVWQGDRAYTEQGRWWTLTRPSGTREDFRTRYAVCEEWSALDRISRCQLREGAHFVLGPGQSASCEHDVTLPRSADNQVYIDNDARQGRVLVERCEQLGAWP